MAKIVESQWVAERLGGAEILLVDPRRPMKYLSGHLPGAINVPVYQAFGPDGRLLEADALADFLGRSGVSDSTAAVLYDSPEGQNAAMLAWILEYLGHTNICVMDALFEAWKAEGREVLYKPVAAGAARFNAKVNPAIRATLDLVRNPGHSLIDFRSREEFSGERTVGDDSPGHIPGAVNLVWRDLSDPPGRILKPAGEIEHMLTVAGVAPGAPLIAYCRSGPRAALGYLALRELGREVRLFDGSYAQWSRAGLPAEK